MKTFGRIVWTIAGVFAVIGLLSLLSISGEANAVQQAGASAQAVGMAVIPYCIARAITISK
jgi:hypothetical protein